MHFEPRHWLCTQAVSESRHIELDYVRAKKCFVKSGFLVGPLLCWRSNRFTDHTRKGAANDVGDMTKGVEIIIITFVINGNQTI